MRVRECPCGKPARHGPYRVEGEALWFCDACEALNDQVAAPLASAESVVAPGAGGDTAEGQLKARARPRRSRMQVDEIYRLAAQVHGLLPATRVAPGEPWDPDVPSATSDRIAAACEAGC
jgi:hypothetical protein